MLYPFLFPQLHPQVSNFPPWSPGGFSSCPKDRLKIPAERRPKICPKIEKPQAAVGIFVIEKTWENIDILKACGSPSQSSTMVDFPYVN